VAEGVAALVNTFPPPVLKSVSRGFGVEIAFGVDTSQAKVSDNMNGDDKFTEEDVAMTLDKIVNTPVVLEVAGCSDTAMERAGEIYEANKMDTSSSRHLQETDTDLVVVENWGCGKLEQGRV
jgi:hypothetical protein